MNRALSILTLCIILFSCASDRVVSDSFIQKRKYRDGFFVANKAKSPKFATIDKEGAIRTTPVKVAEISVQTEKSLVVRDDDAAEPSSQERYDRTMEKIGSVKIANSRIDKIIPFHLANEYVERQGRKSNSDFRENHSLAAYTGFGMGIFSLVSVFVGAILTEAGAIGLVVLLFALAVAIAGVVLSIIGMTESFREDKRGKVVSIIGTVINGIIAVAGLLILFIIVGIYISCATA